MPKRLVQTHLKDVLSRRGCHPRFQKCYFHTWLRGYSAPTMLRWNASNGFRDKCSRVKHCNFQITIMPIGSMGLVYLPTFTIQFMPFMQVNIQSVPWIRHEMLISSFDLLQMVENNFNNFPIIWCPLVSNTSLGVNWKQVYHGLSNSSVIHCKFKAKTSAQRNVILGPNKFLNSKAQFFLPIFVGMYSFPK